MDEQDLSRLAVLAESIASDPPHALELTTLFQTGSTQFKADPVIAELVRSSAGDYSDDLLEAINSIRDALERTLRGADASPRQMSLEDIVTAGKDLIKREREEEQIAGVALLWGAQNQLLGGPVDVRTETEKRELLKEIGESVRSRYTHST